MIRRERPPQQLERPAARGLGPVGSPPGLLRDGGLVESAREFYEITPGRASGRRGHGKASFGVVQNELARIVVFRSAKERPFTERKATLIFAQYLRVVGREFGDDQSSVDDRPRCGPVLRRAPGAPGSPDSIS
jgi:hypothetical protein